MPGTLTSSNRALLNPLLLPWFRLWCPVALLLLGCTEPERDWVGSRAERAGGRPGPGWGGIAGREIRRQSACLLALMQAFPVSTVLARAATCLLGPNVLVGAQRAR